MLVYFFPGLPKKRPQVYRAALFSGFRQRRTSQWTRTRSEHNQTQHTDPLSICSLLCIRLQTDKFLGKEKFVGKAHRASG